MTVIADPVAPIVVGTWSCPTTIHAGQGAWARAAELLPGRPSVLVRDGAVAPEVAVPAGLEVAAQLVRNPGEGGWDLVSRISAALDAHPGSGVVAVGGGAVLDPARLAVLIRGDQQARRQVVAALKSPPGPGLVFLPGPPSSGAQLTCVPTTIGTAAEVSPVAVLPGTPVGAGPILVVSPRLRARTAVLDPDLTAGLDARSLALGLVEPMARVLVPAVAGQAVIPQDQLAGGLLAALLELGDQVGQVIAAGAAPDAGWRLAAALASATTHTAPLALGRPPLGHVLWPIATELAAQTVLGVSRAVSKAEALAGLLPAWLDALGELPDGFGTPARAAALLGESAPAAAGRLRAWLGVCGLPDSTSIPDPAGTARRIATRWSPGFGRAQEQWEAVLLALAAVA